MLTLATTHLVYASLDHPLAKAAKRVGKTKSF